MQLEEKTSFEGTIKNTHHSLGKENILENLFKKALVKGNFESIFLIDSEGMMISEYALSSVNKRALSAMFSLIQNSVTRALKAIEREDLRYIKISLDSGEFILKGISIDNYDKSFILITYHTSKHLKKDRVNISKSKEKDSRRGIYHIFHTIRQFIESRLKKNPGGFNVQNTTKKTKLDEKRIIFIEILTKKIKELFT